MSVARAVGEVSAASITVATVLQWLPALASVGAIVWYGIIIWEKIYGKPISESKLAKWLAGRTD